MLTNGYLISAVLVLIVANLLTRALPFFLEGADPALTERLSRLGKVLPPAMMVLLLVYGLRDLGQVGGLEVGPALLALGLLWLVHHFFKRPLPAMILSTVVYVWLVNMGGTL